MTVLGTNAVTWADLARRLKPDGTIDSDIIELLSQTNELMLDSMVMEGNQTTGHKTTVRVGLPSATWRRFNEGVARSKSLTRQVNDTCGNLEATSLVDKGLVDVNSNRPAFRASEDAAFMESMNQTMVGTTFYGSTKINPERFDGLAPRFSLTTAENGNNVVLGGGSGSDNTSIWFLTWGEPFMHFIIPKGGKTGFQQTDLGEDVVLDGNSKEFRAYRTWYQWQLGLTVRDWRYQGRIANIDLSDAEAGATDLLGLMITLLGRIFKEGVGNQAWYVHRRIHTVLTKLAFNKTNAFLTLATDVYSGKMIPHFFGYPIRRVDQLSLAESLAV